MATAVSNSGDTMGYCLACAIDGTKPKSLTEEYVEIAAEERSDEVLSEDWP